MKICTALDCTMAVFQDPDEEKLSKLLVHFDSVDSRRWISFLIETLNIIDNIDFAKLSDMEKRMFQMFYVTIWSKAIEDWNDDEVIYNLYAL